MIAPLYPLALLYDGVTRGRNWLYEKGHLSATSFDQMLISVGNLSVGGTGKTPMVEYLVRLLKPQYPLATLSRGYGRRTKGFILAGPSATADTLGDEPFQYYWKWAKDITVCVGEERVAAVQKLLKAKPGTEVIVLDDAYQHRPIAPDFQVLLTTYERPFWKDHLLPAGRLRESRQGARRAQALVVSKCPTTLSAQEQATLRKQASPYLAAGCPVFFTSVSYGTPCPVNEAARQKPLSGGQAVLLLSGLANARPLEKWVRQEFLLKEHQAYKDHHSFSPEEIKKLGQRYSSLRAQAVLTSEKDAVRLLNPALKALMEEIPLYYIPIKMRFLNQQDEAFNALVLKSIAEKLHGVN